MLNGPYEIADLSYPDCRADGYYEAKQCHWAGCVCVDKYGKADPTAPTQPPGNFNIQCPGGREGFGHGFFSLLALNCGDGGFVVVVIVVVGGGGGDYEDDDDDDDDDAADDEIK